VRTFTTLLGTAIFTAGCVTSTQPTHQPPVHLELHPYAGQLRYIEATSPVGARFLFDTGGGLTLLSPSLAKKLGCTPFTRMTTLRMNGERFDVDGCGPSRLTFDSLAVAPDAGIFDLMALLPAGLPRLDGLASLQTFAQRVVSLDLAQNRLDIADAVDRSQVRRFKELSIRLARNAAGAALDVFVRIDGTQGPLWFELDSGNLDSVLISDRAIDQLGLLAAQTESLRQHKPTKVSLQIGQLGPVAVTAASADLIYDGALNAATLEQMVLVIDLNRSLAWATLNRRRPDF
jgi:hypothetical protein